jgi:putative oxidoreductase
MNSAAARSSGASLLLRLGVGAVFFIAGLEKLARGTQATTAYFASLNVPFPELTAPLISWFELIGGALLLVGLATVPVAALFLAEMLYVLLWVRIAEATRAFSLIDSFLAIRLELLLALAAAALVFLGAGRWSLDAAGRRFFSRRSTT